jgi:hypothetical protein
MQTDTSIPDDVWYSFLNFLPAKDALNCALACSHIYELVFDVRDDHPNIHAQQVLWQQFCYSAFPDNSAKERERRVKKTTEEEESDLTRHKQFSVDMYDKYDLQYTEGENVNLWLYDPDKLVHEDFCWREMFLRIIQRKEEWKDGIVRQRVEPQTSSWYKYYSDIKPKLDLNVLRFVVCGRPSARKHLFVNKLIKTIGKDVDMYDIALDGIEQVIHLRNVDINVDAPLRWYDAEVTEGKTTLGSLLLYVVDSPYHFAKQFRGSCQVNGVIYVVDTKTFPENNEQVYREFHDIVGEYHRDNMFSWLVVPDGENYELIKAPDTWESSQYGSGGSYGITKLESNPVVTAVCNTLRVNQLMTCHWYDNARPACSGTDQESMTHVVQSWFALIRKYCKKDSAKSETRHVHYPYLSDEEDEASGTKERIPYPED